MFSGLNLLINIILRNYFNESNCLIFINNTEFMYNGNLPIISTTKNLIFSHSGCQGILIFGESPRELFENFEISIRLNSDRFNSRKYLIISNEFRDFFESNCLDFVSDVVFIKKIGLGDDFGFYTHKFVGFGNGSKEIIEIDRWFGRNNSFLYENRLFWDKLANQMGKYLKLATFTYAPYSIPANYDGTEIFFCLEFAKKYNLTPIFVVDEEGEWGEVYDNWTGFGVLGNVAIDHGDIGLGALYIWERSYLFFDITKPALRSGITCLATAPTEIGGWITPFISFSYKMWIMTFFSFLVSIFAIFIAIIFDKLKEDLPKLDKKEYLIQSFMLTQAVFLLQGLSKVPIKARSIFVLILLLSFYVALLYSTELASNMTVPRYKGLIQNAEDLANRDLKWGATSIAWVSALFDDPNPIYKKLVNNFLARNHDDLIKSNDENYGFAVERLYGGCLAIGKYITKEGIQKRRLMDEDVDWEHCAMITRKNSILLPKIDRLILEIAQAGLFYVWEYEVTVRTSDMNLQNMVRLTLHTPKHDKTKLGLIHLEGAFALWFVGIILATIAFIYEVKTYNKT